jgi:uncharacterized protein
MAGPTLLPPETRCWVVTDGKAGDEVQCVGVAQALGLTPDIRRIAPRRPWSWFMPFGPVDPREAPGRPGGPLAGPFPDLLIASGRRAVASLRAVKAASGGRTFTVFLKDPRTGAGTADLIWVPEHDRLRGPNVVVTLTSPHGLSAARLARAALDPPPGVAAVQRPRVALVLGGDSRHHVFTPDDVSRLAGLLSQLAATGVGIMATASRRSPPALVEAVRAVIARHRGFLWDGTGENPYAAMLATADAVVVTADSVNMTGEACATGKPVLLFEPTPRGGTPPLKQKRLIDGLKRLGAVHSFRGTLESHAYEPLDSTPVIARSIAQAFIRRT